MITGLEGEKLKFKPVKHHLKNDLALHPARTEGLDKYI